MTFDLDSFLGTLSNTGILARRSVENFLSTAPRSQDAQSTIRELLRRNDISDFQSQHLLQGKSNLLCVGNYTILDKLGSGGMASVYRAKHRYLNRVVAIKILPGHKDWDREAVVRFDRECKLTASLSHPNIVTAYDADQIDQADGSHILVMECIDGVDLLTLVRRKGPLPLAQAIDLALQVAHGMAYVHSKGVIHRDLKPGNVMLDTSGVIKILDLGVAGVSSQPDSIAHSQLTSTGAVFGTIDYMAPEQAESTKQADARSDIYSLGCMFYFLLMDKAVYERSTVIDKMLAHRDEPVPSLSEALGIPFSVLDRVFSKLIAKKPKDRYQSMAEVIDDFQMLRISSENMPEATSTTLRTPVRFLSGSSAIIATGGVAAIVAGFIAFFSNQVSSGFLASVFSTTHVTPLSDDTKSAIKDTSVGLGVLRDSLAHETPSFSGISQSNSIGMEFVEIPAGNFLLGSPTSEPGRSLNETQVPVSLTQKFWLGKYEVTQGQWKKVMGSQPWKDNNGIEIDDDYPAVFVSWEDATQFCKTLTTVERENGTLSADELYRLPTEAQWEFACRAGTTTAFSFGDDVSVLGDYAWFQENNSGSAHKIGEKKPNPAGLYDMHGNVHEWCSDWSDWLQSQRQRQGGIDPAGASHGFYRVIAGGGWRYAAFGCRSAFRTPAIPLGNNNDLGFRVALVSSVSHASASQANALSAPTGTNAIASEFPDWRTNGNTVQKTIDSMRTAVRPFSQTLSHLETLENDSDYPWGEGFFYGGILAPNGKIYCVPRNANFIKAIDPATGLVTVFGQQSYAYDCQGGVLAVDGKIYCTPRSGTRDSVLVIDPQTNTTSFVGSGIGPLEFTCAAMGSDGRIYCPPFKGHDVLVIDVHKQMLSRIRVSESLLDNAYHSATLAADGKIYCAPLSASQMLVIDPATNDTTFFGNVPKNQSYYGAILGLDGNIYCIPWHATNVLVIDPVRRVERFLGPLPSAPRSNIVPRFDNGMYAGGVLAPDGKIYCVPSQAENILVIDTVSQSLDCFGKLMGAEKYRGGVLTTDGRIFCIPFYSTEVLVLGTPSQLDPQWPLSRIINKF